MTPGRERHTNAGGVYVLRFDRPLGSKQHAAQFYVGWTKDLDARMWHHRRGTGAAITRAAVERGIGFEVVLFIKGAGRDVERQIKAQKNTKRFIERYQRRQLAAN